jgi:ribose 5-phosphate isomerase B
LNEGVSPIIAVGCDHAGFPLKPLVVQEIKRAGYSVLDCGASDASPSDYPDFARKVGEALVAGRAKRGILVCGSGVGVSVAASKIPGVRAALCHDLFSARQGVEHDDMNVLCLGARAIKPEVAAEVIRAFLKAQFSGAERHNRRLAKINGIERDACAGVFDDRRTSGTSTK